MVINREKVLKQAYYTNKHQLNYLPNLEKKDNY